MDATSEQRLKEAHVPVTLGAQLTVIQAIYAVIMALGFKTLAEAIFRYVSPILGLTSASSGNSWIYLLPVAASVALGLRFFWAVVNVRRYIERANDALVKEIDADRAFHLKRRIQRNIIIAHVPILLLHGFGFNFICLIASDLLFAPDPAKASISFLAVYAAYQYGNALWLWFLTAKLQVPYQEHTPREYVWRWNNFVASTLGCACIALVALRGMNHGDALILGCLIYIVSSLIDLNVTAYHYLENTEDKPDNVC